MAEPPPRKPLLLRERTHLGCLTLPLIFIVGVGGLAVWSRFGDVALLSYYAGLVALIATYLWRRRSL